MTSPAPLGNTWAPVVLDGVYHAALYGISGAVTHVHPIPFDSERECVRGCARLNERYASGASSPAE